MRDVFNFDLRPANPATTENEKSIDLTKCVRRFNQQIEYMEYNETVAWINFTN